jgi:hypothetical protein
VWPSLVVALVVAVVLFTPPTLDRVPVALEGWIGGVMPVAHILVSVALVALLGQTFRTLTLRRELDAYRNALDVRQPGWPTAAIDDARTRLYRRHSTGEYRAEIARTAELILGRQDWTWRLGQTVAFLTPAVGFAAGLWSLRLIGNRVPWREVGLPLAVSLAEAIIVLLMSLGVRHATVTVIREWSRYAEAFAVQYPLEGLLGEAEPNPEEDEVPAPFVSRTPVPSRPQTAGPRGQPQPAPESGPADPASTPRSRPPLRSPPKTESPEPLVEPQEPEYLY